MARLLNVTALTLLASLAMVLALGWAFRPDWAAAYAAASAPLAWWQSMLLAANAAVALAIANLHRGLGARRRTVLIWVALGLGLLGAALDERFSLHAVLHQALCRLDLLHCGWGEAVALAYAAAMLVLVFAARRAGSQAMQRWTQAAAIAGVAAIGVHMAFDGLGMRILEELLETLAETLLLAGLFREVGVVARQH